MPLTSPCCGTIKTWVIQIHYFNSLLRAALNLGTFHVCPSNRAGRAISLSLLSDLTVTHDKSRSSQMLILSVGIEYVPICTLNVLHTMWYVLKNKLEKNFHTTGNSGFKPHKEQTLLWRASTANELLFDFLCTDLGEFRLVHFTPLKIPWTSVSLASLFENVTVSAKWLSMLTLLWYVKSVLLV